MRHLLASILFFLLITQAHSFSFFTDKPVIPDQGLAAEAQGNWQEAIAVYLAVLENDPNRLDLWLRVAAIEQRLKNAPMTIYAYQHALQLDPKNAALYKILSEVYAENNHPTLALQAINKAVALKPDAVDYLLARIKIANWNQDSAVVLDSYQRLLQLQTVQKIPLDDTAIWQGIAAAQSQLHHHAEAIQAVQKLLRLHPQDSSLYQQLSQLYSVQQNPEAALATIQQALDLAPTNKAYLKQKAMLATWLKNYTLAQQTYQQLLALDPLDDTTKQQLAAVEQWMRAPATVGSNTTHSPLPAKPLSPYVVALNAANTAALQHHYALAIRELKKAMALSPQNPVLYQKLSQLYAVANQPKPALRAIEAALRLSPRVIAYWRARAALASWMEDKPKTLASYQAILQLKPRDERAMLGLAHTLAWQGKTDLALAAYETLLQCYPRNAAGWLQYADVLTWTQSYLKALHALGCYRALKGETSDYIKTEARIVALAGYYRSAQILNQPLIQKAPNDPYVRLTEVVTDAASFHTNAALQALAKLERLNPRDNQVKDLHDIIVTPLRSNLALEADYTSASDTTRIVDLPFTVQYFLNPTTSFLVTGLYERAQAALGSGLATIDGKRTIFDESLRVGFTSQLAAINFKGLLGALKIQNKGTQAIYDAVINTHANEQLTVTFEALHDLYRAFLVPQSPRSISLQVTETRESFVLQWQPWMQHYVNAVATYATLADNNSYWHANLWPKARIFGSEHWLVTVGVDADYWSFRRRAMDGYYSPLTFNGYEGTLEVYYAFNKNQGVSVSGGWGIQKDETFPHFLYEEDMAMQLFLGIYADWKLNVRGGYTLRHNPVLPFNPTGKSYQCWTGTVVLTRRF